MPAVSFKTFKCLFIPRCFKIIQLIFESSLELLDFLLYEIVFLILKLVARIMISVKANIVLSQVGLFMLNQLLS